MNSYFNNINQNFGNLIKSNNDKKTIYLLAIILIIYICFIVISKKQLRGVIILFGMIYLIYLGTKQIHTALIGGIISSLLINYVLDNKESFTIERFADKQDVDDNKDSDEGDDDEADDDEADDDEGDDDDDEADEDDDDEADDKADDDEADDKADDDEADKKKKDDKKIKKKLKSKKHDDSSDSDDDVKEDYLDIGSSFTNAYKNLSPDQLKGLNIDTQDLLKTQQQLIGTLNKMGPALVEGAKVMDTFKNFFDKESS